MKCEMEIRKNSQEWISREIATYLTKYPKATLEDAIRVFTRPRYKISTVRTQFGRIRGSIKAA